MQNTLMTMMECAKNSQKLCSITVLVTVSARFFNSIEDYGLDNAEYWVLVD